MLFDIDSEKRPPWLTTQEDTGYSIPVLRIDRPALERLTYTWVERGSGRARASWARTVLSGFDDMLVTYVVIPDDKAAILGLVSANAWVRRNIGWLACASSQSLQLRSADLSQAYLHGADMRATNLQHTTWIKTAAVGIRLDDADLSFSYLSGVEMRRAYAPRCDLHKASFYRGDLRGIDLRGANLTDARFLGTRMHGCKLLGANLTGAHLMNVVLTEEDIEESKQPNYIFRNCILDKRKR